MPEPGTSNSSHMPRGYRPWTRCSRPRQTASGAASPRSRVTPSQRTAVPTSGSTFTPMHSSPRVSPRYSCLASPARPPGMWPWCRWSSSSCSALGRAFCPPETAGCSTCSASDCPQRGPRNGIFSGWSEKICCSAIQYHVRDTTECHREALSVEDFERTLSKTGWFSASFTRQP
jgi:hypothetical protein